MTSGLLVVGLGGLVARTRLRRVDRRHARLARWHDRLPEEWGLWFVHGFARVAKGTAVLMVIAALLLWIAAGVGLIHIGVRLASV